MQATDLGALNHRLLDAGDLHAGDFAPLVAFWLQALAVKPDPSSVFVGVEATGESTGVSRLQGRLSIWQSHSDGKGGFDHLDFWPEGYPQTPYAPANPAPDIRTRPWYVSARAAGRSIWTETYAFLGVTGAAPTQGVTYATPVFTNGALAGVVTADVDLNGLAAFLRGLRVGRTGYAFVVEQRADGSRRVIPDPRGVDDARAAALMPAARRAAGSARRAGSTATTCRRGASRSSSPRTR